MINVNMSKFNFVTKLYNKTRSHNLKQRNLQLKYLTRVKHLLSWSNKEQMKEN